MISADSISHHYGPTTKKSESYPSAGMFRKQIAALVLAVMATATASCKKDDEVNSILATVDSFTTEILRRIDVAANPPAGVDDAQKYFDSRRAEIAATMNTLKNLSGNQVSHETKQKMKASLVDDASRVGNLQIRYVSYSLNDPAFKAKLDKLVNDYQTLLTH